MSKELVLIGGGHAHVHVLKMLGMAEYKTILKKHKIHITCISRDVFTPYSGMLPGYIAGHYTLQDIHLDLMKLCQFSNIKLIHSSVIEIVPDKDDAGGGFSRGGYVKINDNSHPLIRYDCLSINVGSAPSSSGTTTTPANSAMMQHHPRIIPVKPISQFSKYYESLIERIERIVEDNLKNRTTQQHTIAVVGGGAGGVELTCSIHYKIHQIIQDRRRKVMEADENEDSLPLKPLELKMILMTRGDRILEEHNWLVRKLYQRVLNDRNVEVQYNTEVGIKKDSSGHQQQQGHTADVELIINNKVSNSSKADNDETITTTINDDTIIKVDDCLWCTSASGPSWLSSCTPFETTSDNFVKVHDTYQVINYPNVFACGDCCHMMNHPRPKAGVFAVRAGPYILDNVIAYLSSEDGQQLKSHKPQSTFLGILVTGDKYAIASKGSWLAMKGNWVWKWKDYLDRTWMEEYTIR